MTSPITPGWDGIRPSSHDERRLGSRLWVDLPMDVMRDDLAHRCRVIDISPTGMVFVLTRALASLEPHLLGKYEIHVDGDRTLRTTARFVWRRGTMEAARFVALRDEDHQAIVEMVRTALQGTPSDLVRLELAERRDALARLRHAA